MFCCFVVLFLWLRRFRFCSYVVFLQHGGSESGVSPGGASEWRGAGEFWEVQFVASILQLRATPQQDGGDNRRWRLWVKKKKWIIIIIKKKLFDRQTWSWSALLSFIWFNFFIAVLEFDGSLRTYTVMENDTYLELCVVFSNGNLTSTIRGYLISQAASASKRETVSVVLH